MESKYNILFTLNSSYFDYGRIFINSLYDNNDMSKVDTVFLADTGLNKEDKEYFNQYPHIQIISTNIVSDFNDGGTWGKGWMSSVVSKTKSLYNILKTTSIPVMMVDADCIIMKDLNPLLSFDANVQLCVRKPHHVPYLGSFVVIRPNDEGLEFVGHWVTNIDNQNSSRAKESPMLGKTVEEHPYIKIHETPRLLVSCHNKKEYTNDVFIIHLKGSSISKNTEQDQNNRIYGTHGFDSLIKKYLTI